jgi:mono/diheme cytochrome c family protein
MMKPSQKFMAGAAIGVLMICLAGIPGLLLAHGWKVPPEAADRPNPAAGDPDSPARGEKLFEQYCALCHGQLGGGDGALAKNLKTQPTNLAQRAGHHPDGDFAWKIANGRGDMPSFKKQLTENQIWDLVNFIQKL